MILSKDVDNSEDVPQALDDIAYEITWFASVRQIDPNIEPVMDVEWGEWIPLKEEQNMITVTSKIWFLFLFLWL